MQISPTVRVTGCYSKEAHTAHVQGTLLSLWWQERLGKLITSHKVFNNFAQMFQFQFWNIEVEASLLNFLRADVEMSVVQKLLKAEEAALNVDNPSTALLER